MKGEKKHVFKNDQSLGKSWVEVATVTCYVVHFMGCKPPGKLGWGLVGDSAKEKKVATVKTKDSHAPAMPFKQGDDAHQLLVK